MPIATVDAPPAPRANGAPTHLIDAIPTTPIAPTERATDASDGAQDGAPPAPPKQNWRDKARAKLSESRAIAMELVATSDSPKATLALNGGLAIAACANFILSAVGLIDYAERVMHYPAPLSWLVPIAVDGFAICAIGALYRERNAPWRVRAYLWLVYAIPTACSVGGNVSHGAARHYEDAGVIGAGAFPILLSFAIHIWIGVNRRTERAKKKVERAKPVATATPQPVATDSATTPEPPAPRTAPPRELRPRHAPTADLIRDAYTPGAKAPTVKDALARQGVDVPLRTIQRRIKELAA